MVAFAFAVAAIVLYSENLADLWMRWLCDDEYRDTSEWYKLFKEKCFERLRPTEVSVR